MKVLMIDRFPAAMRQLLEVPGLDVRYEPDWKRPEVLAHLAEVEVLVMNSKVNVDRELLDAAPGLKLLCRAGVGMDHFDPPGRHCAAGQAASPKPALPPGWHLHPAY